MKKVYCDTLTLLYEVHVYPCKLHVFIFVYSDKVTQLGGGKRK